LIMYNSIHYNNIIFYGDGHFFSIQNFHKLICLSLDCVSLQDNGSIEFGEDFPLQNSRIQLYYHKSVH
jgi:hypothetical protein